MAFFGPNPTLATISDSFAIKPNSKGVDYKFQKFTDFLEGDETGTNGATLYLGDNGSVFAARFTTVGARTGVDSTFTSVPSELQPAVGIRFIRTGSTLNNQGIIGLQQSLTAPLSINENQSFAIRFQFSSVSNVLFRFGFSGGWTQNLITSTASIGFELDTGNSGNFFALKGTSGGAISREDTAITASASKSYILYFDRLSDTSYNYKIWEQASANTLSTKVYDATLTTSAESEWAFAIGLRTLTNSEKIIYLDWLYAKYNSLLSASDNEIIFPFSL